MLTILCVDFLHNCSWRFCMFACLLSQNSISTIGPGVFPSSNSLKLSIDKTSSILSYFCSIRICIADLAHTSWTHFMIYPSNFATMTGFASLPLLLFVRISSSSNRVSSYILIIIMMLYRKVSTSGKGRNVFPCRVPLIWYTTVANSVTFFLISACEIS